MNSLRCPVCQHPYEGFHLSIYPLGRLCELFAFEICSLRIKHLNAAHFLSSFTLSPVFCPFLFNSGQNDVLVF